MADRWLTESCAAGSGANRHRPVDVHSGKPITDHDSRNFARVRRVLDDPGSGKRSSTDAAAVYRDAWFDVGAHGSYERTRSTRDRTRAGSRSVKLALIPVATKKLSACGR